MSTVCLKNLFKKNWNCQLVIFVYVIIILSILVQVQLMEYQKQLRWLLFLLIPFIVMLAVLIIIPLELVSNSHSLVSSAYTSTRINLSKNQIRSSATINTNILQNIINKYVNSMNVFYGFKISQYNAISFNQSIKLYSAFQFSSTVQKQTTNSSQIINKSMWFATNISKYENLSTQLKQIYLSYLKKQPFLKVLVQQPQNNTITSISNLIIASNQSIYFSYPTKYESDYSSLSAPTEGSFYPTIIKLLQSNSSIDSIALIRQQAQLNKTYLLICQPSTQNGFISIPCVHLDITKLIQQVVQSTELNLPTTLSSIYVVINLNNSKQTSPAIVFKFQNGIFVQENPGKLLNLKRGGFQKQDFVAKQLNKDINVQQIQLQSQTHYLCPISIYNGASNTVVMNMLTIKQAQISSFQQFGVQNNLNILIIPIVILAILGSIFNAFILKLLLDGLQKQLFLLEDRCKFIVNGDINIEIPQYKGTQDIKQVYEQSKIINKLHRYSTNSYFTGHFAEKILKYNQAMQFMNSLNYDVGNILENMGQAYTYIEQWDNSISALKRSVDLGLNQLKTKFNLTIDEVFRLKKERKNLPSGYRQFQLILIRRMFKLSFTYLKYLQLRNTFTKEDKTQSNVQQEQFNKKIQKMNIQSTQNLQMMKIAFYPDFSCYSQCIISLFTQSKQMANLKKLQQSKKLMDFAKKLTKKYIEEYQQTSKKLKQKGSKYKLLHQKNKLTAHSRTHPQILRIFPNVFETKIIAAHTPGFDKFNQLMKIYAQGVKVGVITLSLAFTIASQIWKLLVNLKIDPTKFESTQVFKQVVPFKTLYYGQITKDILPQLLKFPTKTSPGLERQFVFLFDCARATTKNEDRCAQYLKQRAHYIFEKLVKKTDRLSIIKFNAKNGIKIQCNLILKESNSQMLKKQIDSTFTQAGQSRGNFQSMIEGLYKTINRIKGLQCDKAIVMFFKSIQHYTKLAQRLRKKKKTQSLINSSRGHIEQYQEPKMQDFGQYVKRSLNFDKLRNCKLILFCAKEDSIQKFRNFFGLQNINKRIWGDYNFQNNLVYIIEDKHKGDIDRILMLKTQDIPDNNVFVL